MPSIPQPLTIRQWSAGALCVIACASAQAQSTDSVQVYGLIDAMARRATNAPTSGATNLADGAYTGSRFGVRGTEGASAVVGVHFTPGGAAAFLGGALPDPALLRPLDI